MTDTTTHRSVCDLATGDEAYLGSDRVHVRIISVDLQPPFPTDDVTISYLEVDNLEAGYRQVTVPTTSAVRVVP